jgi:hypothetical protein
MMVGMIRWLYDSLEIYPLVEIDILTCEQLYGHIIHGSHFLFEYNGSEKHTNAVIALHVGMLRNEERDSAFPQAFSIGIHHIIPHNLYVVAMFA